MSEVEKEAKDFCEWWDIGAHNDAATKPALRKDAESELKNLIRQAEKRGRDATCWGKDTNCPCDACRKIIFNNGLLRGAEIANNEPELEGKPPKEIAFAESACRAAVIATKKSIVKAIRKEAEG